MRSVTVSSTGIGAACVKLLAARVWRVFAGVPRLEDGEGLAAAAAPAAVTARSNWM